MSRCTISESIVGDVKIHGVLIKSQCYLSVYVKLNHWAVGSPRGPSASYCCATNEEQNPLLRWHVHAAKSRRVRQSFSHFPNETGLPITACVSLYSGFLMPHYLPRPIRLEMAGSTLPYPCASPSFAS